MNPYEQTVRVVTVFFSAVTGLGLRELLAPQKFGGDSTIRALCFTVALLLLLRFLFGSANHLSAEANRLVKQHYAALPQSEPLWGCPAVRLFTLHLLCLIIFFLLLMLICYADSVRHFLLWIWVFTGVAFVIAGLTSRIEKDSALDLTGLWLWANGIQTAVALLFWLFPTLFGLADEWKLGFLVVLFLAVLLCDLGGQLRRLEKL